MGLLDLFVVALMPVLKVLLITLVGLFLATDRINLLGPDARHNLNNLVFFVFGPALVASYLAETVTLTTLIKLWFMPVNILLTFVIGSALGWILVKLTATPPHLKGLVISSCSTGNLGNLLLIIVPAICDETNSPFGDSSTCNTKGEAYASASMATRFGILIAILLFPISILQIGAIFIWTYAYNIMRAYTNQGNEEINTNGSAAEIFSESCNEALLPSSNRSTSESCLDHAGLPRTGSERTVPILTKIKKQAKTFADKLNLKMMFAPSTIAAIVGFIIGTVTPIRKTFIGDNAPLRVIESSALLVGGAAIPAMTLIVGANLLKGLKRSGVGVWIILGILAVRYIASPLLGVVIVRAATHFGMVDSDALYQFILMLQYALPPAMSIVGLFLALDRINVLGEDTRKHLNEMTFFVFSPALVGSNLAKTVTFESMLLMWFMPVNILLTFVIGSALGWILVKITNAPQHLKGLIIGCCAAGNLGNLPLIIIPAVCKEHGSPFGAPDVCYKYGMAYASLSMAIGAVYLWSYVYNIVRISSSKIMREVNVDDSTINGKDCDETSKLLYEPLPEMVLPIKSCIISEDQAYQLQPSTLSERKIEVSLFTRIKQYLVMIPRKINLKAVFAPSTISAIVGFLVGTVPQLRTSLIGGSAPFRVVQDSAYLMGEAAIPVVTLILGGNLLKGLKGSGIQMSLVVGIIAVRYIFLPLLGIVIIKGAVHFGLVNSDPLYQFVLLLQYTLPPAMNIGTITQLFGAGQSECSVIMLWTYALASVSLTLWGTMFMWLVA